MLFQDVRRGVFRHPWYGNKRLTRVMMPLLQDIEYGHLEKENCSHTHIAQQ